MKRNALGSRFGAALPRAGAPQLVQALLAALIAVQAVRLAWALVAPVETPEASQDVSAARPAPTGILGAFDPFFRLSGENGTAAVTSLDLSLHGIRQDQASGRGSAIIGTPDGTQRSYAVGEEVAPGVKLQAVDFDSVTLLRNGASEKLFMDQPEAEAADGSAPAPAAPPQVQAPPRPQVIAPPMAPAPPPPNLSAQMRFQPRLDGKRLTGITVQPQGDANALRAAGFAPGDVIVSVGGRRVTSADAVRNLAPGTIVQVERAGRVTRVQIGAPR